MLPALFFCSFVLTTLFIQCTVQLATVHFDHELANIHVLSHTHMYSTYDTCVMDLCCLKLNMQSSALITAAVTRGRSQADTIMTPFPY